MNTKLHIQADKLRPEISMVQQRTAPVSPTLTAPPKDEISHPVDQEFGIGMQFNSCSGVESSVGLRPPREVPSQ